MVGTETPNYLKPKGNSAVSPDWEIQEWMWLWEGSGRKRFWLAWLGSGAIPWANQCGQYQFSHSVVSNSLRFHGLQHARLPCLLLILGACSNSCPLSQWCHPTISSCHPLLLLPSIFPSIRGFSSVSALHIRWPKYWSFRLSISPSNEYSGLISFRIDWFDLLAVQGILKRLLQHHSSKASILRHSAFFIVQISHPYMTIGKTT